MAEKRIIGRAVQKHDIEKNWKFATGFTPMAGEVIIYDPDASYPYSRMKIGDGVHNVNSLPFVDPFVYTPGVDTVVWTGNEEAFDVGALKLYYRISGATPTIDDCANGIYINIIDDQPFPIEDIFTDGDGVIFAGNEYVFIVNNSGVGKEIQYRDYTLVFPYAGIYMNENFAEHISSFVIPGYTGFGARKVIDPQYMPDLIKLTTVTMLADAWEGDSMPYSQTITCNGATANSKVDLQPTAVQIVELQNNETTLMLQNDNGVVTAWAIGNKPTQNYTMQALMTEVVRV